MDNMSLGTGIFWGLVALSFVILIVATKDKWKWGRIIIVIVALPVIGIRLIIGILFCTSGCLSLSGSVKPEAYYQGIAAKALSGEMEVTMPDGSRCDIVTEEYAIEVKEASYWKGSIGQALNYAFQSNKKAGIVLIVEKPTDSIKLMSVIEHYELPITVWAIGVHDLAIKKI
jgi:hypothetical protein